MRATVSTRQVPAQDRDSIKDYVRPRPGDDPARQPTTSTARANWQASMRYIHEHGGKPEEPWVMDISSSVSRAGKAMLDRSPCLTQSRAAAAGHWLSWLGRFMTLEEMMRLMGFQPSKIPRNIVSDRALGKALGNAVPVPLLSKVFEELLSAAGL